MALAAQITDNTFEIEHSKINTDFLSHNSNNRLIPSTGFNLNNLENAISSPKDIIKQTFSNSEDITSVQSTAIYTQSKWFLTKESNFTDTIENKSYFNYINEYLNNNIDEITLYKLTSELKEYKNYNSSSRLYNENLPVAPSESVIQLAINILPELLSNSLIPYRFSPSIEEGLCIMFKKENIIIYVEFYNDGDIGLIAEDIISKKTISNEDISKDKIIEKINNIFY